MSSEWDTGGAGPARRVYQITAAGQEYLESWIASIRQVGARLAAFVAQYETVTHNKQEREQT